MAKREPTEEAFLKDVAKHQMKVLRDDGLYRHLKFRSSECGWNQWFELVTWPGMLTINGDMGTWSFSRVEDMFTFFRSSEGLHINSSYWAEKLQSGDHCGRRGAMVFDHEAFGEELLDHLENYHCLEGEDLEQVREAVREEIIATAEDEGRHGAYRAASDFSCELGNGDRFQFDCCEIPDGMVYSYRFIWCLYAIVWGIQQWDATRGAEIDRLLRAKERGE